LNEALNTDQTDVPRKARSTNLRLKRSGIFSSHDDQYRGLSLDFAIGQEPFTISVRGLKREGVCVCRLNFHYKLRLTVELPDSVEPDAFRRPRYKPLSTSKSSRRPSSLTRS